MKTALFKVDSRGYRITMRTSATQENDGDLQFIEDLYPEIEGQDRRIAAINFARYCEIVIAIAKKEAEHPPALTDKCRVSTIKERSNGNFQI